MLLGFLPGSASHQVGLKPSFLRCETGFFTLGPCLLGRGAQSTCREQRGPVAGGACQSPLPAPTAPGLFLPGSQGTTAKGTGFMVLWLPPIGQLPHGAHNTLFHVRTKNRLREEGKGAAKVTQASGGET